jgi:hypothetical protein
MIWISFSIFVFLVAQTILPARTRCSLISTADTIFSPNAQKHQRICPVTKVHRVTALNKARRRPVAKVICLALRRLTSALPRIEATVQHLFCARSRTPDARPFMTKKNAQTKSSARDVGLVSLSFAILKPAETGELGQTASRQREGGGLGRGRHAADEDVIKAPVA